MLFRDKCDAKDSSKACGLQQEVQWFTVLQLDVQRFVKLQQAVQIIVMLQAFQVYDAATGKSEECAILGTSEVRHFRGFLMLQ